MPLKATVMNVETHAYRLPGKPKIEIVKLLFNGHVRHATAPPGTVEIGETVEVEMCERNWPDGTPQLRILQG